MKKFVFEIKKDFDYSNVNNFRTKKLEGTVELKKADLPGAKIFFISQEIYFLFKKNNKFPADFTKELDETIKNIQKKTQIDNRENLFQIFGI